LLRSPAAARRRIAAGIVAERHPEAPAASPLAVRGADQTFPPLGGYPSPLTLSQRGGPIAAGAPLQLIFWGDAWNDPGTIPSREQLDADVLSMLKGPWRAGLRQYGIGQIPFRSSIIVEHAPPPPVFNETNINSLIETLGDANAFGGEQDLLIVLMPPGTTYGPGGIRGEHYVVDNYWVGFVLNDTEARMMSTLSHELAEMLTDPIPGSGWLINGVPANRGEIGDPCSNINWVLAGVTVQSYWSIADNACLVPTAFSVRQTLARAGIVLAGNGLRSIENPIPSLNALIDVLYGDTI
jgi:hypothetical protein